MASKSANPPLVVLVGETASGKTALAVKLAQKFYGEIICADSRTIYKGMDIGTAKPTARERAVVPHHLLDVVSPAQPFTVADFKRLAEQAIQDISVRGKVPFLVGGTGLYVDAVIYDFRFSGTPDPDLRAKLQNMTVPELQDLIRQKGYDLPENHQNPRHLMRVLETGGVATQQKTLRPSTLLLGLSLEKSVLKQRIAMRIEQMFANGLIEETKRLIQQYGTDVPALQTTEYKAVQHFLDGEVSLDGAKAEAIRNDMQLAKRQRTWFKRNKSIHWLQKQEEIEDLITTFLNK